MKMPKDFIYSVLFTAILAVIFFLVSVFMSCCTVQPKIVEKTVEKTIYQRHDSLVVVPADTASIQALVICDSTGKAFISAVLNSRRGAQNANIPRLSLNNNVLSANCECDSINIFLTWYNRFYELHQNNNETVVFEKKVTFWQKTKLFFIGLGCGLALFLIGLLLKKIFLK
jgi:hypothetical protein